MNTGAFIICHLAEIAKSTHKNVLSIGGTVTALALALVLGHSDKFGSLDSHFLGGHLDIGTLHHISIINTRGGTIRYPHHKQILFPLPNVECSTIANKRNWNCDRVIIRETVLPREEQLDADVEEEYDEGDEGGGDDDDDARPAGEEAGGAPAPNEPIPQSHFQPPQSFDTGGSASSAQMSFDASFLQSFSTLQLGVSGLREGFSGMHQDIQRISGYMDSIEEGVSYFRGFVDRQEERELRQIRREEERAMREAHECEERQRMSELL